LVEWRVVVMASSGLYVNPNTGQTQAGLQPFRNAIINGDMRINQRGTSTNLASLSTIADVSPGSYVVDRWNTLRNAFVAGGTMGQGTALTNLDLPYLDAGITTFSRIGRANGNTLTNTINLMYYMETQDSIKYAGKKITLSFYYKTGSNFSGTAVYAYIFQGTGTDQSLRVGFTNETGLSINCNASLTWQRISFTINVATTTTQIAVRFLHIPTGTALAADYFDITGVQLELGSVATPFEVRPFPVELQLCQRYYEKSYNINMAPGTYTTSGLTVFNGTIDRNGYALYSYKFITCKRLTPSVTFYTFTGTLNQWTYDSNGNAGSTTPSNNYLNELGGVIHIFISVALAFSAMSMYGYWVANAEL